jgi:hypothetical protein
MESLKWPIARPKGGVKWSLMIWEWLDAREGTPSPDGYRRVGC